MLAFDQGADAIQSHDGFTLPSSSLQEEKVRTNNKRILSENRSFFIREFLKAM
jgi:hypothetical protein